MKNILKTVCVLLPLAVISCKKSSTPNPKPYIILKQGQGYISTDTTVKTKASFIVGINATKYGDDILRSINFYCSYNDKPDSLLFGIPLYGLSGDAIDYNCIVGPQKAGKEKYTVTAISQSGASNSVSVTVNIQQ